MDLSPINASNASWQERPFEVLVVSETVLSIEGNTAPELIYFLSQDFMIVGVR